MVTKETETAKRLIRETLYEITGNTDFDIGMRIGLMNALEMVKVSENKRYTNDD